MSEQMLWLIVTNMEDYYGEMQDLMCECGHPVRTHSQHIDMRSVITNNFPINVFPKVCLSCLSTKHGEDICQRWRGVTKRASDITTEYEESNGKDSK
jgi:hypothetical protein